MPVLTAQPVSAIDIERWLLLASCDGPNPKFRVHMQLGGLLRYLC